MGYGNRDANGETLAGKKLGGCGMLKGVTGDGNDCHCIGMGVTGGYSLV